MLSVENIFRMAEVKRWHLCEYTRPQNNAEHSYHVAMLSWLILEELNSPGKVDFALRWSLIHDMPEIEHGDIPAPTKKRMLSTWTMLEAEWDKKWAAYRDISKKSLTGLVVKLSDVLECLWYIGQYGIGARAKQAIRDVEQDIDNTLHTCIVNFPELDWENVFKICDDVRRQVLLGPGDYNSLRLAMASYRDDENESRSA